jgi:hypothetical protein
LAPFEPSLWYGSLSLKTALAEVAYHRLKFFKETQANLGYIEFTRMGIIGKQRFSFT